MQVVDTSVTFSHMHTVTLTPADLSTLRGGGMVQITSSSTSSHTHTYKISCT
jgi:hypothetical protein